ncbi:UDP-N-acetylmuramate--L-alanine ligase [Persicitalea jodogahamensis]|uniref:UDP-N-acetylmuramate--L-alanine ligase n=1 Tax=Persicitalea jodogahamensis TaxID=402147 RepID=A0A8J3D9B8_9BACT|nr:UDP-N-acetylmuramate--L-alanine ligase [Persicitalea jodogahamensis]GHB71427.1 UDP-N-acetylmuramate--L-alanine ligase [Persicitalea jodogahamensis]
MSDSQNLKSTWKNVFFVGIGGIGMSALARWFNTNGFAVGGYDRTPTPLTRALESEGITVCYDDAVEQIPEAVLQDTVKTLIVYTPAIPAGHRQMEYFKDQGYTLQKRSQVLGWITQNLRTVGVAGTHGKTTTSSMVAHLLRASGVNCTAFLGGITQNYGTNFLLNEPTEKADEVVCVVEADEFDRSFLTLHPDLAIVTSTDADHLDIYGEHGALLESFRDFVGQIKPEGVLFMREGLELAAGTKAEVLEYSLQTGNYRSKNLRIENARFVFDIIYPDGEIKDVSMRVPGYHNVENAIAASAAALRLGVSPDRIRDGLASYRGVKRRFEYVIETEDLTFIDDYAHHPTEIEAFLTSVRALYPNRHITAIFQPHLFTRTRDFAEGFATSLGLADRLFLLEIYPAREQPIAGVNSQMLLEKVKLGDKEIISNENLLRKLERIDIEVLVTIGAGDIDRLVPDIAQLLKAPLAN